MDINTALLAHVNQTLLEKQYKSCHWGKRYSFEPHLPLNGAYKYHRGT